MFNELKKILARLRNGLGNAFKAMIGCAKAALSSGRLSYYAALALLLAILATASWAYRNRLEAASAPEEPPRAAVALRVPDESHPPEPTPEPVRWLWPLEGEILGPYSPDEPVWSATLGQWQTHPGLDIAGSPGETVYACADGVVADAWSDRLWGNVIVLEHPEGYRSTYAFLNTLKLVAPGDAVSAGDVLSAVGVPSGCEAAMAAHLHFELARDGESVDFTALAGGE